MNQNDINSLSQGQFGSIRLESGYDTTLGQTSKTVAIIWALEDSVIEVTPRNMSDGTSFMLGTNASGVHTLTIPAGVPVFGQFSLVNLTSGVVVCYFAP